MLLCLSLLRCKDSPFFVLVYLSGFRLWWNRNEIFPKILLWIMHWTKLYTQNPCHSRWQCGLSKLLLYKISMFHVSSTQIITWSSIGHIFLKEELWICRRHSLEHPFYRTLPGTNVHSRCMSCAILASYLAPLSGMMREIKRIGLNNPQLNAIKRLNKYVKSMVFPNH